MVFPLKVTSHLANKISVVQYIVSSIGATEYHTFTNAVLLMTKYCKKNPENWSRHQEYNDKQQSTGTF